MQKFINNISAMLLLALVPALFSACNKEDVNELRAMQVIITGYNGSGHGLQVAIDTTVYDASVRNGQLILKAETVVNFYAMHTYSPQRQQKMVVITDTVTKAVVFRQALPIAGTKAHFNFMYIDGKEVPSAPPAADPNTNKLGIYVRYTEGNDPLDIFLYRADENGNEHRVYLARNVKSNRWVYTDYLAPEAFAAKIQLDKTFLCFTKAGTTDQWALRGEEEQSRIAAGGLLLPLEGEKGIVQQYCFTPGEFRLDVSRMFFFPDRVR